MCKICHKHMQHIHIKSPDSSNSPSHGTPAQIRLATTIELPSPDVPGSGKDQHATAANIPLRHGQTLANRAYTVQHVLSIGTMATVYLATDHTANNRDVVIKAIRIPSRTTDQPQKVQATQLGTLREADLLASLRHPTLPRLLTTFRDTHVAYIVMEYIKGSNLEQGLTHIDDITGSLVEGQPCRIEEVRRWGIALCRTLEYLANRHPQPVIHRDLKPANIVIDRAADTICLVDFSTSE